jgi:glycogen synthase
VRILILSNLYPPVVRGGYEVECRDVVEHLRAEHEVTVLASRHGREDCPPDDPVLRELPWLRPNNLRDSLMAAPDALRAARVVRRALARVRPDVIYVWNGAAVPSAAISALLTSGIPTVFRVCEYWFGTLYSTDVFTRHLTPGERGLRGLWARAMRAANRLPGLRLDLARPLPAAVCWNSEWVRAATPVPPPVRAVHEAVVIPSNARTGEMAQVRRAPEPGRVLFVGRLEEQKGAWVVVRALGALAARGHRTATLTLVGPGDAPERDALARLAEELGVADRVRLTGPLRGAALEDEIAAAAAWVVPSVWDEPAPLTCTEAALARVPAVFSRVGGIPEMFREGEQALFFARGDHEGCAAALAEALEGGEAVQARVARAFERGRELSFGPYVAAMDRFLHDGVRVLQEVGGASS